MADTIEDIRASLALLIDAEQGRLDALRAALAALDAGSNGVPRRALSTAQNGSQRKPRKTTKSRTKAKAASNGRGSLQALLAQRFNEDHAVTASAIMASHPGLNPGSVSAGLTKLRKAYVA